MCFKYTIFEILKEQFMSQKLIFIYNADSGLVNSLLDGVHKILSPTTYACSLCKLTHGAVSEKKLWIKFTEELKAAGKSLQFLHKDEFRKVYRSKFGHKFTFPILLVEEGRGLEVLMHTSELNALESTEELIALVRERM